LRQAWEWGVASFVRPYPALQSILEQAKSVMESLSFVPATQSSRQSFSMPSAIFISDIPVDACER
jgi:hypothetical protein